MSKSKVKKDTIKSKSKISDIKKKKNKSKTSSPLLVLKTELKEEKEKYLRLFAEFENYKKRTSRERIELFKTANKEVMSALIPILDDYDRANSQINDKNKTDEIKGLLLIFNKMSEILKSNGLSDVKISIGDVFDSEIHEAITQIKAPNENQKGKIIDVIEKGYQLGEKIVRFPKVVVGK
ncbi:MAG: nucleotide exchange factor GrpE [Flavobacteriaceae bacterium]|nr:nucleotide exchange factor GrpE [Flavobacteriaceae bacterium]|tara:strand:+ start:4556 stop:5095 length:540 start_codon:yes stop_codon:yes gene_type:complete